MNPFDLRGPEFLFFYIVLSGCTTLAVLWLREWLEGGPTPQVHLDDPYFFAYLRGGMNEVYRAAIVVLIDRGWLISEGDSVHRREDIEPKPEQPGVEQEVLSFFYAPQPAYKALKSGAYGSSSSVYERRATELGLMPDDRVKGRRQILVSIAVCTLVGISLIKIAVALSRGRTNVLFLIILTFLAPYLLGRLVLAGPTAKGKALLRDVQVLFGDLKGRRPFLRPGAGTKEIAWLVSVFGLGYLPNGSFPDGKMLFPLSSRQLDLGGGASTGCGTVSSCGSGGGGCGGGCGGGGCGGGCGGCGS